MLTTILFAILFIICVILAIWVFFIDALCVTIYRALMVLAKEVDLLKREINTIKNSYRGE